MCETDSGVWVSTARGMAWYNGYYWQAVDRPLGMPARSARMIFSPGGDSLTALVDSVLYTGNIHGFRPLMPESARHYNILEAVPVGADSLFLLIRDKPALHPTLYLYSRGRLRPVSAPDSLPLQKNVSERARCLYSTNGALWLNTVGGLYRLRNGVWTMIYRHISFAFISHVIEDGHGNGFFFVSGGPKRGFWRFSKGDATYTTVGKMFTPRSVDTAPDGTVLVVYSNGIISSYGKDGWNIFTPTQTETIGINFARYRANGDLWLQTPRRLSLYRASSRRWQYHDYGNINARNHINEILRARDGTLWVAAGYGLHIHRPGRPVETLYHINGTELEGLTGLGEDSEGHIWVSSGGGFDGAFRWDGSVWKHIEVRKGLGAARVHKIRSDRNGRLWFLTLQAFSSDQGDGAYMYDRGTFTRWSIPEGLMNSRVYSFVEGRDGARWFGTISGISRWHHGRWKHWNMSADGQGKIFALAVDSTNRVWYSRYRRGFGYIANDSLHDVPLFSDGHLYDNDRTVVDIQVDTKNRVWIATEGHGLYCYANGVISNLSIGTGLGSMNMWPILFSGNRLYIGTHGRGLNVLSLDDDESVPDPVVLCAKPIVENTDILLRWQAFSFWGQIPYGDIETRYRLNNGEWSGWSRRGEANLTDLDPGTYVLQVQAKGLLATYRVLPATLEFDVPTPLYRSPFFALPVGLLVAAAVWLGGVAVVRKRNFHRELRRFNSELEQKIRERTLALVEANTQLQGEIAQRRQAEEGLQQALLKEKELHELKSRFVTMVSHEFRTPLSVILSSAELLHRYGDRLAEIEKQKYHQRINNAVEHFTKLMDDVLFIGRVGSGQLDFQPALLHPEVFGHDIATEAEAGQEQRIRYSYEGEQREVIADGKLLQLILINTLTNALKYSPPHTPVLFHITVTDSEAVFTITDEGMGIPAEDLGQVYEAFHRGANVGNTPGTGLGMTIVRDCVRLHNGTIEITSVPGSGTTVRVAIPVGHQ